MELVDVVLFLHVLVLLLAFGIGATLHAGEWQARRATTVGELRGSVRMGHRLAALFPVMLLLLFGLGAWLIHLYDGAFDYQDGWVSTAIVAIVVLGGLGGGVLAPRAKRMDAMLDAAPAGDPLTAEMRAEVDDPVVWVVGHLNTFLALSVVYNMFTKPGALGSVVVLLVGASVGAGIGALSARAGREVSPEVRA